MGTMKADALVLSTNTSIMIMTVYHFVYAVVVDGWKEEYDNTICMHQNVMEEI